MCVNMAGAESEPMWQTAGCLHTPFSLIHRLIFTAHTGSTGVYFWPHTAQDMEDKQFKNPLSLDGLILFEVPT